MNDISQLQWDFIDFAKGMPAISISWEQISRDINDLKKSLEGTPPNQPSLVFKDIRLPVDGLAYSVFLEKLTVTQTTGLVKLDTELIANVHPLGHPGMVIRTYKITMQSPNHLSLEFDDALNEVFWRQNGQTSLNISSDWGADYLTHLESTSIPAPKDRNFLDTVDRSIIWLIPQNFIKLVTDTLPRYNLTDIVPWLRFRTPLKVSFGTNQDILLTSSRATIVVGDCTLQTIEIEPDPNFPYGETIPNPSLSSANLDYAVYAPKTRLLDFVAKKIEPAILVKDSGGGVIKWSLAGSVGLERISIDILPSYGLSGVIEIHSVIDFVAAARAWIDGPCGTRLSLASASVLGNGDFAADIHIKVELNDGYIEAFAVVTQSEINDIDWDINTPLGYPLDSIASVIIDHISKKEVRKLARKISRIGKWEILGLSEAYKSTYESLEIPEAYSEGCQNVSTIVGVYRKNIDGDR